MDTIEMLYNHDGKKIVRKIGFSDNPYELDITDNSEDGSNNSSLEGCIGSNISYWSETLEQFMDKSSRKKSIKVLLILATLLWLSPPALSQEPESAPEPPSPAVSPSPLVGAAWCTLRVSESKPESARPIPGGGGDSGGDPNDPDTPSNPDLSINDQSTNPGCDIGAGLALYRFRRYPRLSWVAVLGRSTTGTGLAWTAYRPTPDSTGPILAVAIGAVVRYDVDGIYVREVYPALGATLSFMRGGKD